MDQWCHLRIQIPLQSLEVSTKNVGTYSIQTLTEGYDYCKYHVVSSPCDF